MLKRLLFGMLFAGALLSEGRARATGDVFNLQKPAYWVVQAKSNSEWMYARKSDATIWRRQIQTGVNSAWTSVGKPGTGATSGPEFGTMRYDSSHVTGWIIASATGGIFGLPNGQGTTWVKLADFPQGGATSGPAVSSSEPDMSLHVAIRGAGNIPFVGTFGPGATPTTLSFSGWQQVNSLPIDSGPGIAEWAGRLDVVALFGKRIKVTTCSYPTCFGSWTDLARDSLQSPSAHWIPFTPDDGPWLAVSALGTDSRAWVRMYDFYNGVWGPWTEKGSGATFDAAVSIGFMTNTPGVGRLSTHGANSYWFNPGGNVFSAEFSP